jgi:hypothetical protein
MLNNEIIVTAVHHVTALLMVNLTNYCCICQNFQVH